VVYFTDVPEVIKGLSTSQRELDTARLLSAAENIHYEADISDILEGSFVSLCCDELASEVILSLLDNSHAPFRLRVLEAIGHRLSSVALDQYGIKFVEKLIQNVGSYEALSIIEQELGPFVPLLMGVMNGNKAILSCLHLGSAANDYIYRAIARCLKVLVRSDQAVESICACYDSRYTSVHQKLLVATEIIVHAAELSMSVFGRDLVSWLLDFSGMQNVPQLVASTFMANLEANCLHPVAHTVVKQLIRLLFHHDDPEPLKTMADPLLIDLFDDLLLDKYGVDVLCTLVSQKSIDLRQYFDIQQLSAKLVDYGGTHLNRFKELVADNVNIAISMEFEGYVPSEKTIASDFFEEALRSTSSSTPSSSLSPKQPGQSSPLFTDIYHISSDTKEDKKAVDSNPQSVLERHHLSETWQALPHSVKSSDKTKAKGKARPEHLRRSRSETDIETR